MPVQLSEPVRVYADGVFDLFHYGHARVLQQAKSLFPQVHLMVGVHSDDVVHAMKGPTVLTYDERLQSVAHCRWVDEVVGDAPWVITREFLAAHHIDIVAHDGDPYPCPGTGMDDLYDLPKRMGIFRATQRTPNVSTTDLIQRVLDDHDLYATRNLHRLQR
jgi:choline-phosphate cytidylyltransferase